MSKTNPKYKRLEALFSETKPAQPDPGIAPANREVEELKAQVAKLESKLVEQQVEPAERKTILKQENQTPLTSPNASRSLKLSRKIMIPVLVVFSLAFLGFTIFSYLTAAADASAKQAEDSRLAEEFFQSKIQNITDFASGLAIQTATNPDVQAAFAARDREALLNLTYGTFQALEAQYQVRQFQFHLPPATSFLRLHSTSKFGDDLSTFRFTVLEVNATQHPIAGLEVGRGGAGIRGVQPVFYGGKHIGSVEFGLNFDKTLVTSLKEEFGNDWRILLTRDALSLATLEDLSLLEDGPTPDTLVLASTIEAGYPDASTYAKILNGERLITAVNSGGRNYSVTSLPLRDYSGKIIGVVEILIDRTAIIQAQNNRITLIVFGMIVSLVVGAYFLTTVTNRSLQPLGELTLAAESIERGNLNQKVQISSHDEIGQLGNAFNQMSSQLQNLFDSLERRVLDRTHDLELASEVGRAITEKVSNVYGMLSEATEMIRSRFDLYYTQVYLLDPSGNTITLRAGTGDIGQQLLQRGHHLLINSGSLNGRAVSEKKPIVVADTTKNPNFLPNPLLPNTRSEIVVPLMVSGRVFGVLDMQSEFPDALNQSNLPAFEALAGQMAIAIQNAILFAQSEEARREMEANARGTTESGWQNFLNAIERGERIGYTFNQVEVTPMETGNGVKPSNALSVPIKVTGANVGSIQLVEDERNWTAQETEIIQATADQLAQHIDNLRLLAQAESYRSEAEQAVRRLTREGWENYVQARGQVSTGYFYDLNEVKSLSENSNGKLNAALKLPLMVRDETIGELAVNDNNASDESAEIIGAVVTQLSGHIENLRLSGQNEKRAYELATVATVSTTASTVLDPDKLLQAVVDLTKERFNVYHTHIYLADEAWKTLLLAAGAGEVGRQMVATGHAIQMDAEKSLVARASRERTAIIANDVLSEADFLPNPLLAETRAEMAVPMIVGDKVIGVFDVQSDKTGYFTAEDADIYATLAAQVAVALQNARLYVEQSATVTQLRELDRLKSSFLANMSHELRTPLNSILGFADVIIEELDGPLTENMSNDLKLIQKNGQHLLHLINDVLDMAKIESGRMNLNPERFRIHDLLEEVTSITSTLASEKNLSLSIANDSNQSVEMFADRTRLRQVMINLVNNAIKFTERGKITIHVSQPDGTNVLIRVKDTGIGIASDKLEAIFQEFTQVDTSTTRRGGGTGLGLPISRRLVELHGGRLWAESTGVQGEGSTFSVELPLEALITEIVEKQAA